MGSRRLVLVCLSLSVLASSVHAAALSTEEPNTFVVAKSKEDDVNKDVTAPAAAPTTEEPNPPIKMTAMEVDSVISLRYARTSVVARVRNPARRAQEAAFRVLLPDTAFISGFTMILDGKPYKAYVKEKEEAKEIYDKAVSQGIGAAHIAAKARDSNHFTVSVNVEGNASAVFNLTYEELLTRRDALYAHAVNLHPGAPVPRLAVTVRLRETQRLRRLRVPPLRTGNEVDAAGDDAQNPTAVIERGHDDREATITFKPDLEEQRRLAEIYAEKSKESQAQSYNRFEENGESNKAEGILGQFVVQYDVEQPKNGEILVNDGYFVHFFAPSDLPPLNKHVVFVLDTSGSMGGRKIEQLREAMQTILSELNKGDYFSIVEFNSNVQVHDLKEADQEPLPAENYYIYASNPTKPVIKVPPSSATPVNVAKAKVIVSRLTAQGGTNIYDALDTAVELIQKGVDWKPMPESVKPENNTKEENDGKKEKSTDVSVVEKPADSGSAVENVKKLEPIIIFLTDGDPTTGLTDTTKIINRITEKNYGPNKASLFSLAFGEDADRSFLRKLSLRNDGFMRHIYEAADAALQLRAFYRQVASPLLADVTFVYPPDQVKEGSLTRTKFRTVYGGSETVVAGRVAGSGTELEPQVIGVCGVDDSFIRKSYKVKPVKETPSGYLPLERLWAYLTIKQLLDERDAAGTADSGKSDKDGTSPEKRALELALKYEFVTPLTSLVVVKPNATDAINAESVDQQSNVDGGGIGVPLASSFSFNPQPIMHGAPQFAYKAAFPSATGQLAGPPMPVPVADFVEEDLALAEYDTAFIATGLRRGRFRPRSKSKTHHYQLSRKLAPLRGPTPMRMGTMAGSDDDHYPASKLDTSLQSLVADEVDANFSVIVLSTEATPLSPEPPTPPTSTSAPAAAPSLLQPYHLEAYPWVTALLVSGADAIRIEENGNQTLQLSKDDTAPQAAGGDAECANATDGGKSGACVYLTRCQPAKNLFANHYVHFHCAVNDKYAGVCCPKAKVDVTTAE